MGNQSSTHFDNYAYRVVTLAQDSPASLAGIEPHIDFIKYNPEVNNDLLFSEFLAMKEDIEITLVVYNLISRKNRVVAITPNKQWENADSLLGITIRFEDYLESHNNVLFVQDVYDQSPA